MREVSGALPAFVHVVPDQDGYDIQVSTDTSIILTGTVIANVRVDKVYDWGQASHKEGWTMTYSDTVQSYVTTASGFSPSITENGGVVISTTQGLQGPQIEFVRAFVQNDQQQSVISRDGYLEVKLPTTGIFASDAYIAITPSFTPPGEPPDGYRILGKVYSARASGALSATERPFDLHMTYDDLLLNGALPNTLDLFRWDEVHRSWERLDARHLRSPDPLNPVTKMAVATSHFGTYALMETPSWHDDFDNLGGLEVSSEENTNSGGSIDDWTLTLFEAPGVGSIRSLPIEPPDGFGRWERVEFSGSETPPTATLTVNVLGVDGEMLQSDVQNGRRLSNLSASDHPVLQLEMVLATTSDEKIPSFSYWRISWSMDDVEDGCGGGFVNCTYLPLFEFNE